MNDEELLELAAKAAGIEFTLWHGKPAQIIRYGNPAHLVETRFWNPRDDDGDALRLAVKLKLNIQLEYSPTYHYANNDEYECLDYLNGCCTKGSDCGGDPYAATRRAIVRAAAEIGKGMK